MILSPQQDTALRLCAEWIKDPSRQVFYLAGFAGTGKSTLAKHLVSSSDGRWLFAALTGKAAHVLRQKLGVPAQTIHSLIYRPAGESTLSEIQLFDIRLQQYLEAAERRDPPENTPAEAIEMARLSAIRRELLSNKKMKFTLWPLSTLFDKDVAGVVIDECSMVDERVGKDLESFGKKILVLGDPAQLPPVHGGGYFTNRKPDFMLTEVHRHAKESSVLRLATLIREGGSLDQFRPDNDCRILPRREYSSEGKIAIADLALNADQVLVGTNKTRIAGNKRHRELLGRTRPEPELGDKLVCLRNDREIGVFNGSIWKVVNEPILDGEDTDVIALRLESDDQPGVVVECVSWLHHMLGREDELQQMSWGRRDFLEFSYGYSLTVHKSQGSQWNNVLLVDESSVFRNDARRHLYTGITRAAQTLTILS